MPVAEPQDLVQLLSQMEYWRQEPPKERKRAFKRFEIRGDAILQPVEPEHSDAPPAAVMLRDISRGGIGFLCDRFLEPGSVWRIEFLQRGYRIGSQPVAVRYCRLVQEGLFLVGGQFVVEPFAMVALGVDPTELTHDIQLKPKPEDTAEFVAPDSVEA